MSALPQVGVRQLIRVHGAAGLTALVIFLVAGVEPSAAVPGTLGGLVVALVATLSWRSALTRSGPTVRRPRAPGGAAGWQQRQQAFERWFAQGPRVPDGRRGLPTTYGRDLRVPRPPAAAGRGPAPVDRAAGLAGALAATLALAWLCRRRRRR